MGHKKKRKKGGETTHTHPTQGAGVSGQEEGGETDTTKAIPNGTSSRRESDATTTKAKQRDSLINQQTVRTTRQGRQRDSFHQSTERFASHQLGDLQLVQPVHVQHDEHAPGRALVDELGEELPAGEVAQVWVCGCGWRRKGARGGCVCAAGGSGLCVYGCVWSRCFLIPQGVCFVCWDSVHGTWLYLRRSEQLTLIDEPLRVDLAEVEGHGEGEGQADGVEAVGRHEVQDLGDGQLRWCVCRVDRSIASMSVPARLVG